LRIGFNLIRFWKLLKSQITMKKIVTIKEQNPRIMKKIFFTLLFLMAFLAGFTQVQNAGGIITVESGATLVIEGSYTSSSSGDIVVNGNVELKGHFINNGGTINSASSGTMKFNGTSAQEIKGSQTTAFNCNVEINNAGGVSLTSVSDTLKKGLTFTSGKLTLNAYDLTLGASSTVTGAGAGKYIVTNSTGKLRRPVGGSDVAFAVGNASYNPLVLNEAGTADTYGVTFADALPGSWGGGTAHTVLGSWTVTEAISGGNNLTATAQWNGTQEQTGFARTDCAVGRTTDNGLTVAWKPSAGASGGDPYTKNGTGFTGVGKFMVADYWFEGIDLDLDLFLAGPYSSGTMSTALKTAGLIPLNDPYGNSTTVASIPANAVDWIEVQLRNNSTPSTIVKKYSFFVDNAGNVLNVDGTVGTKLTGVVKGTYKVAVRHRNHLGVMKATGIDFTTAGPFAFNFAAGSDIYGTNAMQNISGTYALWAGDANSDGQIIYQGASNDPTPIGTYISGFSPSFTYVKSNVYQTFDVNLDGSVVYQGSNNDPTPIGYSVSNHPGNTGNSFTYVIAQQLP